MPGLVAKAFNGRPKTKQELLTAAFREFGAKVMDVKKLMKTAPAQLRHKDTNARAAAKGLAVEVYRWLGPVLKTSLERSFKPVQVRTYTCVYVIL